MIPVIRRAVPYDNEVEWKSIYIPQTIAGAVSSARVIRRVHPPGEIDECPRLHVCAYAVTHVAVTHVAVTHVAVTYVALPMRRYLARYRHIGSRRLPLASRASQNILRLEKQSDFIGHLYIVDP